MASSISPYHPALAFGDRIEFFNNADGEDTVSLAQRIANFCEKLLAESSILICVFTEKNNGKNFYFIEEGDFLIRKGHKPVNYFTQAERIALICTLILPLFALIYKAIYRGITLGQLTLLDVKPPKPHYSDDKEKEIEKSEEKIGNSDIKEKEKEIEGSDSEEEDYKDGGFKETKKSEEKENQNPNPSTSTNTSETKLENNLGSGDNSSKKEEL